MAEYIERDAAMREEIIAILANCDCETEYCKDCKFGDDLDGCIRRQKEIIADHLIAADVVPKVNDAEGGREGGLGHVVRCKDCRWIDEDGDCAHEEMLDKSGYPKSVKKDFFCGHGEKRALHT